MKKSIHTKEHAVFVGRLKKARLEAKMTQAQVATKLSCTQSYISKVESGELKIDVIELQRFAKIYDKQIRYFVK